MLLQFKTAHCKLCATRNFSPIPQQGPRIWHEKCNEWICTLNLLVRLVSKCEISRGVKCLFGQEPFAREPQPDSVDVRKWPPQHVRSQNLSAGDCIDIYTHHCSNRKLIYVPLLRLERAQHKSQWRTQKTVSLGKTHLNARLTFGKRRQIKS